MMKSLRIQRFSTVGASLLVKHERAGSGKLEAGYSGDSRLMLFMAAVFGPALNGTGRGFLRHILPLDRWPRMNWTDSA